MSVIPVKNIEGYHVLDEDAARAAGRSLAERYRTAEPFPHIVLDDFLDADLLRKVHAGFPSSEGRRFFDRDQERLKFQYRPADSESALVRNLLAELNSDAFLAFLEEMTSIAGLVPDPYYHGGGLHETMRGGHLGVHADFNIHDKMKLERRLNLLIYLNEDWRSEYGGELELWEKDMSACRVKVAPQIGRAVIFSTNSDSFHGHPDPLTCPPERSRRSIATYYYTAFPDGAANARHRNTDFRVRKGSQDRIDWNNKRRHFISDWVPPRLQGIARRIARV
jgi:Rps23 Pro-64 3,4-dihydroxylase Tpa1-like proline 4-hydroxylase